MLLVLDFHAATHIEHSEQLELSTNLAQLETERLNHALNSHTNEPDPFAFQGKIFGVLFNNIAIGHIDNT